jgi:hypothetical protein
MNSYVLWLWLAGTIQITVILANAVLPAKLDVRAGVASLPRFLRQVFVIHWIYVVLIVFLFSLLCFLFPRELAGGSALGRFLTVVMALFWLLRFLLQLFYYDPELRRRERVLDLMYLLGLFVLIAIFSVAAIRPMV